ncbi:hypothetical protein AAVH_27999 [Aphelenchoides avenae]|nr:hypothetical protein AAVH_27999 [Aphelenchus avenae]
MVAQSKAVPTGPPKRLRESIYVTCSSECSRTVVERGLLLPVAISCPITLSYDCRYKINAGDKFFGEFLVGPATSSSSRVNALITFDIGANGALTGSIEYDGTKMEFKNAVSV